MENRKLLNEELERKSVDEFRKAEKMPLILILENVRSMNNVGSVFRSADAFLIEKIYLCGYTPCPPHREIQKTALGATETVLWEHSDSALDVIRELKQQGVKIFSIEQAEKSIPLQETDVNGKLAVVFGNEVEGVSQEVIDAGDGVIEIPQHGMKHSLNIAVAAGIVCWEIFRKKNY
ncbi:MAG TPA: RNA methyltransferase [Bacteroidia bacterium]|jgi:tRNA G18 (ribose-2'-O)-methylase SpoU|nr:RNA methyltransferase [Bacteroidia bacterium]